MSSLDHIGKQIIKSLRNQIIQLQTENNILQQKLAQKEREIEDRYKEINKLNTDNKINTDQRIHTQDTTEIQTSLTQDIKILHKEEETTELTNNTLHDKTNTLDNQTNTDEQKLERNGQCMQI